MCCRVAAAQNSLMDTVGVHVLRRILQHRLVLEMPPATHKKELLSPPRPLLFGGLVPRAVYLAKGYRAPEVSR